MRHVIEFFALVFLAVIWQSCSMNNALRDKEIEQRANKIANSFDSEIIAIFKDWSLIPRGESGIWQRNVGDTCLYRCVLIGGSDQMELRVFSYEYFLNEYNVRMKYDTAYWRISFLKYGKGKIRILGVDNHGVDQVIKNNVNQDSLFPGINPFLRIAYLNELKAKFGIIETQYFFRLGDIIRIYLSPLHILTYIPDTSLLEPTVKKIWLNEFLQGKIILKHWSLRKIEKPTDN